MSIFTKASRIGLPVKLALFGPSGSGKTYTALSIATGIAGPEGRIGLVDTEHGSSREYADVFNFEYAEMLNFHPQNYVAAIREAEKEGFDVLILDGITPAWNGIGGVQEIVDKNTKGNNTWSGWSAGTPAHQQLLEGILAAKIHLICTMRSKTAWAVGEGNKPVMVGLEPIQRQGVEYEFAFVGMLDLDHQLTITKSRRPEIPIGEVIEQPGAELGKRLRIAEDTAQDGQALQRSATPTEKIEAAPQPPAPEAADGRADALAEAGSLVVGGATPTPDGRELPHPNEALPLDPIAAESEPEPTTDAQVQMIEQLDKVCSELAQLRPEVNWFDAVNNASKKDYNVQAANMTPEQGAKIIERLKVTLLQAREQKAAAASAS